MAIPEITESHVGSVHCVTLGATPAEGGTRAGTITVGGAGSVVYAGSAEQVGQEGEVSTQRQSDKSHSKEGGW